DKLQEAQENLIQSERLAAIGRISSSLAHEINNPLVAVLGNAQLLLTEIPEDNPWRKDVEVIERCALTCKRLLHEVLGFARRDDFKLVGTNVHWIINKALMLTQQRLANRNVQVEKMLMSDSPLVQASEPHLEQVFVNLIVNAQQAMPNGGTLKIHTYHIPAVASSDPDAPPAPDLIAVEFKDTGTGIIKENLKKILEPFFTTKKPGEGTGLGLSVCNDIVKKHHGHLVIESEGKGMGSTITVRLPLSDKK
ncbi:MAG TPA: ATP-binding protein, partial [Elusimicrobiota bacterium]|nr:ATP-binding protein [Elusimicrobiota bacterium]